MPPLLGKPGLGLKLCLCCQCDYVAVGPLPILRGGAASLGMRVRRLAVSWASARGRPSRQEWSAAGTPRSWTADLSPFNHSKLGHFMLFSGSLFNLILKICLHSIQNRFLIALSLKNVEQISLQDTSGLNGSPIFPLLPEVARWSRAKVAPGRAALWGWPASVCWPPAPNFRMFCSWLIGSV